MTNLLKANIYKLLKSKAFYILFGLNLLFVLLTIIVMKLSVSSGMGMNLSDNAFIETMILMNIGCNFLSVLAIVLFLGNEYKNGAIRNKIIIGKNRTELYLANAITGIIIGSVIFLSGMLEIIVLGLIFFGMGSLSIGNLFLYLLEGLLFSIVFSSLYSFIAIISNRANRAILFGIIVYFSLEILVSILSGLSLINNTFEKVINIIYKIIPDGQVSLMLNTDKMTTFLYVLFATTSLIYTALFTFLGLKIFKKMDIK